VASSPAAKTIRKFVDGLPLLGDMPNGLGQSLPIAKPTLLNELDSSGTIVRQSDYYIIGEVEYTQQLHSDLPATRLRGYVQLKADGTPMGKPSYLGPVIVAQRDRAVRVKLVNQLPVGPAAALPFPVDHTYMGANDTDNRTAMHLHGGNTPWISDGTPRQWIKPDGEVGSARGESARDVPDMWFDSSHNLIAGCTGQAVCPGGSTHPGPGALTFYYTNQQSARLMFYHDHAEGITRLNVYAGLAAGYLLQDPTEQALVTDGILPDLADTIPLVIQEKTFVPDNTMPVLNFYGPFASQLNSQDPTWRWGTGGTAPGLNGNGDLWAPHVYMTNQNPGDASGANAVGRWDYGPWFWPPFVGTQNRPIANPYFDAECSSANPNSATGACEGATIPGVPNGTLVANDPTHPSSQPSGTPEAFNDTALVNGTVYPHLEVEPKKYRLRLLSVGNDRHLNLSLVVAASKAYDTRAEANSGSKAAAVLCDGSAGAPVDAGKPEGASPECTEVRMFPWDASQNQRTPFPSHWYTPQKGGVSFDGRPAGVFDPASRGPAMVQIGTDGGFLSKPVIIRNQPINYEYNVKNIVIGNVKEHALLLGPAERADVVVDFSQFAGATVILYNDAPAATPAADLRLDYYTGNADNTDTGGAFRTLPGYGPNTRTLMQFRVASGCASGTSCGNGSNRPPSNSHPVDDYDAARFDALASAIRKAFRDSQEPIIVPQAAYNAVYGTAVNDAAGADLSRISDTQLGYRPLTLDPVTGAPTGALDAAVTLALQPKSIIEDFTLDYGRMNAMLGVEMPHTTAINQTSIPQGYIDPMTELVKISSNGTPISGDLGDGTQLWKITHNGVDTHPVHFHLFHVQVVNRVGWDGAISPPEDNELGWKDTVRMNPLTDTIVALRPRRMALPFKLGNSHRKMDPENAGTVMNTAMSFNLDPTSGNASNVTNTSANFGWEYLWHCHILGHEENDFMRAIAVAHTPEPPTALSARGGTAVTVTWTDNSVTSNWVEIQRATDAGFSANLTSFNVMEPECDQQQGCSRSYVDRSPPAQTAYYRVRSNNTVGAGSGKLESGNDPNSGAYLATLPPELAGLTPQFAGYSNATANSDWSGAVVRLYAPIASLNPNPLIFPGTTAVGSSSAVTAQTLVTLSNIGNASMTVNKGVQVTGPFARSGGTCQSNGNGATYNLAAGASCTIGLSFTPNATCAALGSNGCTGSLTVTDNDNNVAGSTQRVQLQATGVLPEPLVSLSPNPLVFTGTTAVGSSSQLTSLILRNTGNAPLTVNKLMAVTSPFARSGGTCTTGGGGATFMLAPNARCSIGLSFTPTANCASLGTNGCTGTVTVTDNANNVANSTQVVQLQATGVQWAPPNAPSAVTPANGNNGGLITAGLNWSAPSGGGAVSSYSLRYAATAAMTGAVMLTNANSGSQVNVGGPARMVYMQVQAVNAAGTSAWTPVIPMAVTAR
jgi:FtsP/CotA-like multicopper oxidase with cupredoxin domain